ncbi:MAG: 50S ribosomal protein L11 methyltransferase [Verrucomicrobiales bacterium]|nr:50S ribosomal protein L11 methyltransferase [Verrucomicrobiales bacterium]
MKPQSVYQVSAVVAPVAEDAVTELLFTVFEEPSSAYVDLKKKLAIVSVYLPGRRRPTNKQIKQLEEGLVFIRECGLDVGSGEIHERFVKKAEWLENWKKHFTPLDIGGRLLIKPSWEKRKAAKGAHEIVLDPGVSFGTGHHATTGFCLEQLVALRDDGSKQSVLDIGTGSGILAIGAAKLGYGPIVAYDFNADSVRSARENCERNKVADSVRPTRKDLTRQSVDSVRKYHVVCANLIYDLLIAERERITNRVRPGGMLVLAGILETQFNKVRRAFADKGMKLIDSKVEGEWKSASFRWK